MPATDFNDVNSPQGCWSLFLPYFLGRKTHHYSGGTSDFINQGSLVWDSSLYMKLVVFFETLLNLKGGREKKKHLKIFYQPT